MPCVNEVLRTYVHCAVASWMCATLRMMLGACRLTRQIATYRSTSKGQCAHVSPCDIYGTNGEVLQVLQYRQVRLVRFRVSYLDGPRSRWELGVCTPCPPLGACRVCGLGRRVSQSFVVGARCDRIGSWDHGGGITCRQLERKGTSWYICWRNLVVGTVHASLGAGWDSVWVSEGWDNRSGGNGGGGRQGR